MMRGYLSIGKRTSQWPRFLTADQVRMLCGSIAMGVLAGLFISQFRLHLGLPGHKAIFWLTAVVFARLVFPSPVGATAGALSAACTALLAGGSFAGSAALLPLVALAGGVLDVIVKFVESRKIVGLLTVPVIGLGGMLANLVCLSKKLLAASPHHPHSVWGIPSPFLDVISYAVFGLLAGLIGAMLALAVVRGNRALRPTKRGDESL